MCHLLKIVAFLAFSQASAFFCSSSNFALSKASILGLVALSTDFVDLVDLSLLSWCSDSAVDGAGDAAFCLFDRFAFRAI